MILQIGKMSFSRVVSLFGLIKKEQQLEIIDDIFDILINIIKNPGSIKFDNWKPKNMKIYKSFNFKDGNIKHLANINKLINLLTLFLSENFYLIDYLNYKTLN